MNAETLRCKCGVEVRVVRLNRQLLALGHVTNPRQNHHPVRLAPSSAPRHPGVLAQSGAPEEALEEARRGGRRSTSRDRVPLPANELPNFGVQISTRSAPPPPNIKRFK